MSEALFQRAAKGRHEARSAGTRPGDRVHDSVVTVMSELDVELSDRKPRLLTTDLAQWADVVVTMGCGDECPFIPGRHYIDWDLPDPKNLSVEEVRALRDDISTRVIELTESMDRKLI
jgi:protein-tyrosine-phosphatase